MNCKNGTLNNLQKSIISTLVISLMLFNRAYSLSTCQCQQVDSAQDLRDLIYSQRNDDGISQDHLLLCPFDLATSPIAIDFPIHIQCYKENLNHQCILRPKYNQQSSILKIESGEAKFVSENQLYNYYQKVLIGYVCITFLLIP